jgi:hypothetical protein
VGRTQRALTSLVAAIPAGLLTYLLVMVFLNQAESLSTLLKIIVGVTLAASGFVAIMPIGLLIFGGKKAAAEESEAATSKKSATIDIDDDAVEEVEVAEAEEASDGDSLFDVEESDDDIMADSDDEIASGSADEIETDDLFDDEPTPKKRKK